MPIAGLLSRKACTVGAERESRNRRQEKYMILAEKIMNLRKKSGWSQEELAEKLNISRQSVSKWESGASIPDIDKIILLSGLFEVSTDYLLKDEIEEEEYAEVKEVYAAPEQRSVSLEEANRFVNLTRKLAGWIAAATALCVLSPIPLLMLAGLQEYGGLGISENMAGGMGVTVLLILVAAGVAGLIFCSMTLSKYEYMEKENLVLQYGVQGVVEKRKEDFSGSYTACVVGGTVLCILAVIPIMAAAGFDAPDLILVYCTCGLLAVISAAVFLFVWSGCIHASFDKILQEGDYTIEKKSLQKKTSFFPGAYWCAVTALFLCAGFSAEDWKLSSLIWPVAALVFVVLWLILKAAMRTKEK